MMFISIKPYIKIAVGIRKSCLTMLPRSRTKKNTSTLTTLQVAIPSFSVIQRPLITRCLTHFPALSTDAKLLTISHHRRPPYAL